MSAVSELTEVVLFFFLFPTATGPHFYQVRQAHQAIVQAFEIKLAARMVNWDDPCRLSDLLLGINFASAEACRQGNNAVALIIADIQSLICSKTLMSFPDDQL